MIELLNKNAAVEMTSPHRGKTQEQVRAMLSTASVGVNPNIRFSHTSGGRPVAAGAPVPSDAARFLGAVFAPTDLVHVRLVETWNKPDGQKESRAVPRGQRWFPADYYATNGPAWHNLMGQSAKENANVFFGICPRLESGGGHEEAWAIRTVRVLWADLDNCTPDEAKARCGAAGLPQPSVIVASGHGVHLYWILDIPYYVDDAGKPPPAVKEWVTDKDGKRRVRKFIRGADGKPIYKGKPGWPTPGDKAGKIKRVLAGIAKAVGGDHTIDLARLMRLPGTLNRKNGRNGAEPKPCVLVECDADRRYPLAAFEPFAVQEAAPAANRRAVDTTADATATADMTASVHVGKARLSLSDLAILDKAANAANWAKFDLLYRGDSSHYGHDKSRADAALAAMLTFWTDDAAQIERVMRQSGLKRDKWDERPEYLTNTIAKALNNGRARYGDAGRWADDLAAAELADLQRRGVTIIEDDGRPTIPAHAAPITGQAKSDLHTPAVKAGPPRPPSGPGPDSHPDFWREESEADAARRETESREARHEHLKRLAGRLEKAVAAAARSETAKAVVSAPDAALEAAREAAAAVCAKIEAAIANAFADRPHRDEECGLGKPRGYYRKDDPKRGFYGRLSCGRLRCDHCRCRIHAFWKRHAAGCVLHEVGTRGLPPQPRNRKLGVRDDLPLRTAPVYLWAGDAARVRQMQKRIARACAAAGVKAAGGRVIDAFGGWATVVADVPFEGAQEVPPAVAADKLSRCIEGARHRAKAVSFWGRWRTPEIVKEYNPFGVTMSEEEAEDHIIDGGAEQINRFAPGEPSVSAFNGGFSWRFPESMDKEDVLRIYAGMNRFETEDRPTLPTERLSILSYTPQSDHRIGQSGQDYNGSIEEVMSYERTDEVFERHARPGPSPATP